MAEVVSRSKRSRKASSHVRVFDAETRRHITQKKLDALEADNWQEDKRKADDDDDEYDPLADASSGDEMVVGSSKRQASKKNKAKRKRESWSAPQQCKSLQEVRITHPSPPVPLCDALPRYSPSTAPGADHRRGAVSQVPIVGAQLSLRRCGALALPAPSLLCRQRGQRTVQVRSNRGLPRLTRSLHDAPRDAPKGPDMMRRAA